MRYVILIFAFLFFITELDAYTVFDNCKWQGHKKNEMIDLYWIDKGYPCFYKAETIVDGKYYDDIIGILTNFEKYPEVFSGTIKFDVLEKKDNVFLIYCLINFFPLKNRDYLINAKYNEDTDDKNLKSWTLLWYPTGNGYNAGKVLNDKFKHVKKVNGRWTVRMLDDNKLKISVEYHNDWEVDANKDIKISIEKTATVNALKNLLKHLD